MGIIKILFLDAIWDVVSFPIFWYSKGMVLAFRWAFREIIEIENFLGLRIWVKNILTPMYGQRDIGGRIISFFMRAFQIIVRSVIFICFSLFYFLLFLVYLALPVIAIWGIGIHIK